MCNLLGEPLYHSGVVENNADEELASLDSTSEQSISPSPPIMKIEDVHLHLDLMFQKMHVKTCPDASDKFHHPEEEFPFNVIIPCYAVQ